MSLNLNAVEEIVAVWITKEDGAFYRYKNVTNSIIKNKKADLIRVTLQESYGNDDNMEVVIRKKGSNYFFKSDAYDDPTIEYKLTKFDSQSETILFIEDEGEIIYFHLQR